jgi:DNA repair exonuclease SbcCD ATPase subunit
MEEYKELEELRKQISENEDTAIKLLNENIKLRTTIGKAIGFFEYLITLEPNYINVELIRKGLNILKGGQNE